MDFGINQAPAIDLLREQLLKLLELVRGGTVDYTRSKIPYSVLLPDFGVNLAALTEDHLRTIVELSEILLANRPLEVDLIVGRASQTGTESNNLSLSNARARAVLNELTRLQLYPPPPTVGLGSSDPIQDMPNVESELNRSVEISLWYDLSYHFDNESGSIWDDYHPAEFWRKHIPGSRYDRAALVVQLVYDNIDTLYLPIHSTAVDTMTAITVWQDDDLVKRLVNVVLGFGNMIFSYLGLYLTQYVV